MTHAKALRILSLPWVTKRLIRKLKYDSIVLVDLKNGMSGNRNALGEGRKEKKNGGN